MSFEPATTGKGSDAAPAARYAMLWRWHFYAALFVMPLLIVLGITGTIYLYKPQLEALAYKDQLYVTPAQTPRMSQQALYEIARRHTPDGVPIQTAEIHNAPDRSAQFTYADPQGGKASVFLNPYTGEVLATMPTLKANATYWIGLARQIHRGLMLGKTGEIIMELAACWTLIMIATGVALWWPRRKRGMAQALKPDLQKQGRLFWREIHATAGIVLAAGALFFVLSGLPWSSTWGASFKQLVAQVNLGYPASQSASSGHHEEQGGHDNHATGGHEGHGGSEPAQGNEADTASDSHAGHGPQASAPARVQDLPLEKAAWGAGLLPVPASSGGEHAGHGAPAPVSLDQVMATAHANAIPDEYAIVLPNTHEGVFTVSYYPGDPTGENVLNVDQYSGKVINSVAYPQYGIIAKIISFAVSLHMGTYFGWLNQLIAAVIALGLCAMAVTGFVMWWRRRPAGRFGAPRIPSQLPSMRGWIVGLVVFGVVFPVTGLSMLVVWALDRLYLLRFQRQARLRESTT